MSPDRVTMSMNAEDLAFALEGHRDFRVQRRLADMDRRASGGGPADGMVGAALAIQTSGDDHRRHRIIELSLQRFRLDERGCIVETGERRTWLEEAATEISAVSGRDTDLIDADLIGRSIADGEATAILLDADFVVTHDARFSRPFVEKRLPLCAGQPWACSLNDFDWRREGRVGSRLAELIGPMGWFHEERRAEADVSALLRLMDHGLSDGTTMAGRIVDRASRADWIVDVVDPPESAKDVLRVRGYALDEMRGLWSSSISDESVADEIGWATIMIYGGRRGPDARKVTWKERYA